MSAMSSEAPEAPVVPFTDSGRHDPAMRRQSTRGGRDKGCRVYIAAEQLAAAGYDPHGPAPYYRIWPASRGGLYVRLYKEA